MYRYILLENYILKVLKSLKQRDNRIDTDEFGLFQVTFCLCRLSQYCLEQKSLADSQHKDEIVSSM